MYTVRMDGSDIQYNLFYVGYVTYTIQFILCRVCYTWGGG